MRLMNRHVADTLLDGLYPGVTYTLIEKDHLGDWSPEKDYNSPSQDSNHPDDLFQSSLPDNLCEIQQKADFCLYLFAGKYSAPLHVLWLLTGYALLGFAWLHIR